MPPSNDISTRAFDGDGPLRTSKLPVWWNTERSRWNIRGWPDTVATGDPGTSDLTWLTGTASSFRIDCPLQYCSLSAALPRHCFVLCATRLDTILSDSSWNWNLAFAETQSTLFGNERLPASLLRVIKLLVVQRPDLCQGVNRRWWNPVFHLGM